MLNLYFFDEIRSTLSNPETNLYLSALPPSLKLVLDVLQTIVKYVEHRLSKQSSKK